jgi:threonylcarbamoyladenosine tRNA methylthiotransferase MtaB
MQRLTASIKTLGCKLNQYEGEQMRLQLQRLGYRVIPYDDGADVCVINSCTVTSRTDRETRRLARGARRLNPGALVVVTGCCAQVKPCEIEAIAEVDIVFGNAGKQQLAELIPPADGHEGIGSDTDGPVISDFSDHTRAFVKVQEGCDARCAYCIIPAARGASRSVPTDAVLAQCLALTQAGYPEIILIGTHLGRYGLGLDEDIDLARLIELIGRTAVPRLRISSIEPREVTDEIIGMVARGGRARSDPAAGKLCRHLHIPLQSGCDSVLRRMGRPYETAFYRDLILRVKQAAPDTCIGADVIVGFPGETDAEFEATRSFISELPLSYLHVFTYSERQGTPAAAMPNPVDYELRKARNHVLRDMSEHKRAEFAASMVGKHLEVVLQSPQGNELVRGISDNYLEVDVADAGEPTGRLVDVVVTHADNGRLQARPS